MKRLRIALTAAALCALASFACRRHEHASADAHEAEPWAVTAWGETFEIFPEIGPLAAGKTVQSGTHVTRLSDFGAVTEGRVTLILDGPGGAKEFSQSTPKRPGIFVIDVTPPAEGDFALSFRVESGGVSETIPAGKVHVGSAEAPGESTSPPPPPNGPARVPTDEGSSFLKEQQWKTGFATEWSKAGSLRTTVVAPGRIVPAVGGEIVLTAPLDAIVAGEAWPHAGQEVGRGARIFRLLSRAPAGKSLAELEGDLAAANAEATFARGRLERLEDLLKVEATSRAEVERAKSTLLALDARRGALRKDLDSVGGGGSSGGTAIASPIAGRIAELFVSPGQAVAAGERLARLFRTTPVGLEIALRPADLESLGRSPTGITLRRSGSVDPISIPASAVRRVSSVPELRRESASVTVLLELDVDAERLPFGSTVEAELATASARSGVVLPDSALVDDGGTTIVWEQVSGESFARRDVRVVSREGDRVLVDGIPAGIRIVTKGGAALRRATLLSSGAPEGHVH